MAGNLLKDEKTTPRKVTVVGGGLVGSLCAIFLAKRGFHVDLYEARQDPRLVEFVGGRSTNLGLSTRGIEALKVAGALESILPLGVAVYGRKIHPTTGDISTLYFEHGENIPMMAMQRRKVNEKLLSAAETYPNVHLHFKHKLVSTNLETGHLVLSCPDGKTVDVDAQLVIGADGAHSTVRSEMMKRPRFDFSQEYISHGYKELQLLPNKNGEYAFVEDYLHIWPRDGFMLIAIPNKDPSFTCTLFMPYENFETLETKEDFLSFFNAVFPDFVQLMGEERILEDFFKNPVWHTVSVKCKPYHFSDKVLIIGDAAHAMVPFFGQGMNSSDLPGGRFNLMLHFLLYFQLRSLVNSFWFLLERKAMYALNRLMPKTFIPLHTMVTYTHIPFHEVVERNQWQEKMVRVLLLMGSLTGLAGLMVILKTWRFRIS
ncbi:kynurenine 3-monooxygenase-like [Stylophora pistillata]|uniref:kynurenine 3-monooxygenase-like n=1 Tax=Stylophora pistillata TaxID=50429 RepID=UPI000C052201|nr:kynurenine 3-monooxygenase-like [Stylophora pistillata]